MSATVEMIGEGFGHGFADSGGGAWDEDGGDVRMDIGFVGEVLRDGK